MELVSFMFVNFIIVRREREKRIGCVCREIIMCCHVKVKTLNSVFGGKDSNCLK